MSGVVHERGIGDGSMKAAHRRVISAVITVVAEQLLARTAIRYVSWRSNIAALVVATSLMNSKHADVAVAVKEARVILELWRVESIWSDAVERTIEVQWDLPFDFAVEYVSFETRRRRIPRETRITLEANSHLTKPLARRVRRIARCLNECAG